MTASRPAGLRARLAVVATLATAAPFAAVALPAHPADAAPATVSRAAMDRLESRVRLLTTQAEAARNAVIEAADEQVQLRMDLDRLAGQRDGEQAKVDAAIVELYERSVEQDGTQAFGPSLGDLNPGLADRLRVGVGVSRQVSAVETLDAHAVTLSQLAEKAQRYQALLRSKANAVFAAEDEALTLLAAEKDQFGREQRAADVARIEAEQQHLRDISDQVSSTVSAGIGRRGLDARSREATVIALLNGAGSGYPAGYGPTGQSFDGTSSWYGPGFEGKETATGAPFDPEKLTCAMKSVPLGTVVRVTHGSRSVNLLVNDRGPYVGDRIIDVSRAGSRALGFDGLAQVHIEVLGPLAG